MNDAPITTATPVSATTELSGQTNVSTQDVNQTQTPAWYSNIKDEGLRGYAEARGFNSNEELLSAYKQLDDSGIAERAGNTLIKPNPDDAESMSKFYKAIGRPDTPDAYKLLPENQQPTDFTKTISQTMFENGITTDQAQALSNKYNELAQIALMQQQKDFDIKSQNEMESLKQEWANDYGRNVEMFRRGVKGLGVSNEEFANIEKSVGTKRAVEIFKNAASGLTEAQFRNSNDNNNNAYLSKEGAQAELNRLAMDKNFADRLLKNDVSAMEKWERLNRLAMDNNNG